MKAVEFIFEQWSDKYKRSINCSNPKGFSQKAHCAGRKKNEDIKEEFEQKYLWHGSRQKIDVLEPRQSVDTGGAEGSNQNAIYATSDPKVAIAMGLTTSGSDTGMFPNDPQMVLFSGNIRKGENVYLHKLPFYGPDGKPQFVQGAHDREFYSIPSVKEIKPIEIKAVPVNKYLNLIRKATPADLELQKKYMKQSVEEGKKKRKPKYAAYGPGPYGWYGYDSGYSGDGGGDGGASESIRENDSNKSNVIFLNDNTAIVGQEHGKTLKLSDSDEQKIKAIADKHGAWYEGNGMDKKHTKGVIDRYQGSWDDDLLSPSIKGYPAPFLYVLFSNIKENDTVKGKIGFDPDSTIFDRILDTQPSTNYFPDRKFDADALEQFLRAVSEDQYDFVKMSQEPATEQNVTKFFKIGEQLMWPKNWEQYPNRAGKVAKSVNDLRDKFLASRKRGVYVTGRDHLIAVQKFLDDKTKNFSESLGDRGEIPSGPQQQLIPFPKGTTMIDVSDVYDWYKLGMVISDLDDANPAAFGKGAPSTAIVFSSEEEEHKMLPLLKRLGLKLHDIDTTQDVKKVIPAKQLVNDLAEAIRHIDENFADGKNPGRKGLSKRMGVNTKASVSSLRKTAKNSSGEKQRMAHWLANMKAGRAKAKRK